MFKILNYKEILLFLFIQASLKLSMVISYEEMQLLH
jgi:hypothetical protein